MSRINFINPFGTDVYDELIQKTLSSYALPDTELVITHLTDCPVNIDYYWYKHLIEKSVIEAVMKSEKEGFDAVIVGCCYDPGVRVSRELVNIPVIGPLEASLQMASYFGHSTMLITDHFKAIPHLKDMIRLYGYEYQCKDVECIDWWVIDIIKAPLDTARDAFEAVKKAINEKKVESVILACTIISASLEYAIQQGNKEYAEYPYPILNPNTMALKMAESLADLYRMGKYNISRLGYYAHPKNHNKDEFEHVVKNFTKLD